MVISSFCATLCKISEVFIARILYQPFVYVLTLNVNAVQKLVGNLLKKCICKLVYSRKNILVSKKHVFIVLFQLLTAHPAGIWVTKFIVEFKVRRGTVFRV